MYSIIIPGVDNTLFTLLINPETYDQDKTGDRILDSAYTVHIQGCIYCLSQITEACTR